MSLRIAEGFILAADAVCVRASPGIISGSLHSL